MGIDVSRLKGLVVDDETEKKEKKIDVSRLRSLVVDDDETEDSVMLPTTTTDQPEANTTNQSPEPPKEDNPMWSFWDTYMGDTAERMGAGAINFVGNIKGVMNKGRNFLYSPTDNKTINKIVGSAVDVLAPINPIVRMMQMQNIAESLPLPEGADKFIDGSVETEAATELRNKSNRYNGKTFVDLWKEKDYTSAAGEVFLTASESLPQSLMAAFAGPAGLAVTGAAASNEKYDNLDANNTDMGEAAKITNAILTGSAEALSEKLGSVPIGNWMKGVYAKVGKEAAEETLKKGFSGWMGTMFKKAGILAPPIAEGVEEIASALAENVTDKLTGADPTRNLTEGLFESFVYGAGGGAQFSAMALPGMAGNQMLKAASSSDWKNSKKDYEALFPEDAAVDIEGVNAMSREEQERLLESIDKDDTLTDEQREVATNLVNASIEYKARRSPEAIKKNNDARKELILKTEMRSYDNASNKMVADNGMIQGVFLHGDIEKPIYIQKGTVHTDETDPTLPNEDWQNVYASDQLYYTDADGYVQVTTPKSITGIEQIVNAQEARSQYEQMLIDSFKMQEDIALKEVAAPVFENNDEVEYLDAKGKVKKGIVVDAFSNNEFMQLDNGEMIRKDAASIVLEDSTNKPANQTEASTPAAETQVSPVLEIAQEPNTPIVEDNAVLSKDVVNPMYSIVQPENVEATPSTEIVEAEADPFPRNKSGDVDFDSIDDDSLYAKALDSEFGDDALSIVEEFESEAQAKLSKISNKNPIEKRRASKALNEEIQRWGAVRKELETIYPDKKIDDIPESETSSVPESIVTDQDYAEWVLEESDDETEIFSAYKTATDIARKEEKLPQWQQELLGKKVNPESFNRFGDKSSVNGGFARAWLKKDGINIDTYAEELSEYGVEVTPQEIIDFMTDNPTNYVRKTSELQTDLAAKWSVAATKEAGVPISGPNSATGKLYIAMKEKGQQTIDPVVYDNTVSGDFNANDEDHIDDFFHAWNEDTAVEESTTNETVIEEPEAPIHVNEEDVLSADNEMTEDEYHEMYDIVDNLNKIEDNGTEELQENTSIGAIHEPQDEVSRDRVQGETNQEVEETPNGDGQPIRETLLDLENREPISNDRGTQGAEVRGVDTDLSNTENEASQPTEEAAIKETIAIAESVVNTSPSEAQKESGNYKKGHIKLNGFKITIEQPKGSTRSGVDENGKPWSVTMNNTYGYFKGTKGKDGDQIDTFIGPNELSDKVFVVDQVAKDGTFDEHKVMLGFTSKEEAESAYYSNYENGWTGLGGITEVDTPTFKSWAENGTKKMKPFAEYKSVEPFVPTPPIASSDYGKNNKIVTIERYEELKRRMRELRSLSSIRNLRRYYIYICKSFMI